MTTSEQKAQALNHLEVYAELVTASRDYYIRSNYMLMAAGALAICEDLQIIDKKTAEEFRKNYINWGDV